MKHDMIKRLWPLALVLLLTAALLVGCDNGNSKNNGNETSSESNTERATVTETATQAPATDTETETATATEADADTKAETETETDPETVTETASETDTATESQTESETVTAPERYDYLSADVSADVELDASAYTDMKLTIPSGLQITDEDVQDYIKYLRFKNRTADNGTAKITDGAMKAGDSAFIYYKGEIDGVAFDGGSNWDDDEPYELGLGSSSFIPGFEDGLIGVIPANTSREAPATVQATFPEDYGVDTLNGKTATFYVYVEYAIQYTLPDYDRDFVENTLYYEGTQEFYASDKALLVEFEQYLKTWLESQIAEDVEYAKLDALWTYLTETAVCRNLPQSEIDFYYDSYKSEITSAYAQYSSYYGDSFTSVYPDAASFSVWYMGLESADTWETELLEMATNLVKKDMIIHAIAEHEGMETVTDEEYNAIVNDWVDAYYGYLTADEIIQSMGELYLRQAALANKMQDWLMERVEFSFGE